LGKIFVPLNSQASQEFALTINAGSSSIKFALFQLGKLVRIIEGSIEGVGLPQGHFTVKSLNKTDHFSQSAVVSNHSVAITLLMNWIKDRPERNRLKAIGHRVVHGGTKFRQPTLITNDVMTVLQKLSSFDPEHLPEEIQLIEAFRKSFPDLPQIACFDTTFHHDMPRVAQVLPIPRRYEERGVRRYGFHGLSYTYLMQELERVAGTKAAKGRVILAHLGSGASMAAVLEGRSMDTTMSFTPASGQMMSTRSGDIDPGLVSFLSRSENMSASRFDQMVNHESGLLGVSEVSPDMKELLLLESKDVRAQEAVSLFCYQAKKCIGAYAALLGGLDTLVFSGGIGENAPAVRVRICEELGFLGIELNGARNSENSGIISRDGSRVTIRVIQTNEEQIIAQSITKMVGVDSKIKEVKK
jgi:acetate kinase